MRQVLLKEGKAIVEEVPVPSAEPGRVLVRTAFSILSAGTERAALHAGETPSLFERATDPAAIRKAVDLLRSEGPAAVVDRLRATREPRATAPGYAASGWVQSAGPGVLDRAPGTAVACAGAGHASHAEWISVPRQLTVPVPEGVPLDEAAFATLGSIALQGVRRSGIQIGECAVVLGLGLVGGLTAQILRAARYFAISSNRSLCALKKKPTTSARATRVRRCRGRRRGSWRMPSWCAPRRGGPRSPTSPCGCAAGRDAW